MMLLDQQIAEIRQAIFSEHWEHRSLFEIEMASNFTSHGLAQAVDEPADFIILNRCCQTRDDHTFDFGQQRDRRRMIVM